MSLSDAKSSALSGERVRVEELATEEGVALRPGELGQATDLVPLIADDRHLGVDDVLRLVGVEVILAGGRHQERETGVASAVTSEGHGLGRGLAKPALGTEVIRRAEHEPGRFDQCSVVAGVVVGVPAEDVERDAGEELAQVSSGRTN